MRFSWLALLLSLNAGADALVRVSPRVFAAAGSEVRLSQLCDSTDLPADLSNELAAQVVGRAPLRLATTDLTRVFRPLVARARAGGVAVKLNLPPAVEVVSERALNAGEVQRELIALWQPACAGCRLELEGLSLPNVADVRDWAFNGRFDLPRGSFSVPITLSRGRGGPLTAWVSGRLKQLRRVPVARRLIQAGERVADADVEWTERDVAQALDGIPKLDEITGRHARRGLTVGEVIWSGTLERERAVRRGESVRLTAGTNGWEVSLSVTSPQDAFVGDVVNFKNVKSGNVVVGRVTGPGEAEIR